MSSKATVHTHQQPLLEARDISCTFNAESVVKSLNLSLDRADVLGLVGLNGAGKSTTLRMLCGLIAPTTGEVLIGGHSLADQPAQARQQLGYLPDPPSLHDCLSVREAIDICARLHNLNKAERRQATERVLQQCQLESVKDKRIKALSKGFVQRTGLALALVHNPALLILDEPASGLDPAQTQHLNQLIKDLASDRAIIFSSHSISDVQNCCTRVALLHNGTLTEEGSNVQTGNAACFTLVLRKVINANALLSLPCVVKATAIDELTWQIELREDKPDTLAATVLANNWGLQSISPQQDNISAVLNHLRTGSIEREAA